MIEPVVHLTVVPHTHWDREWYLPFEGFLERLVPMIDQLLDLAADGFPHFHLDGQTALVEDYLSVRADRAAELARAVAGGQLAVGPYYTQVDEFLTSGETQIRNLEWGLARAAALGDPPTYAYLPDQFGHIGQIPQLLRLAGLDRVVLWRGVPATIDRTSFIWEAPDGSRVRAEYLIRGYSVGARLRELTDPAALAAELRRLVAELGPHSPDPTQLLVMAGNDHHGPDPTLPMRLEEAAVHEPAIAATVGSLAAHLEATARVSDRELAVWRGELRSAARAHLLPNVYSTRVHQKQARGRIEALVERYAEPLAALVEGVRWPAGALDRIWQLLLYNGAHDSVCGCSVDDVAAAVDARHAEAYALARAVTEGAMGRLAADVARAGLLRINPSPFERDGVPPLGWRVVDAPPPPLPPCPLRVDGATLLVGDGVRLRLVDEPDLGDLYDFCPAPHHRRRVLRWHGTTAVGDGVAARIAAHQDGGLVRLDLDIDNRRGDHRLRLEVATDGDDGSVALVPFELVRRPRRSEGSSLEAPAEDWPARGAVWSGGVAVLAEGVFEYAVSEDGWLAVSLLRCVGTISRPDGLVVRPVRAGPDVPTPGAQMLGHTRWRLWIAVGIAPEELVWCWERAALPLLTAAVPGGGRLPSTGRLLELDGPVALSSVRRRGDRTEVRVWNPAHRPAVAVVGGRRLELAPWRIATIDVG